MWVYDDITINSQLEHRKHNFGNMHCRFFHKRTRRYTQNLCDKRYLPTYQPLLNKNKIVKENLVTDY